MQADETAAAAADGNDVKLLRNNHEQMFSVLMQAVGA